MSLPRQPNVVVLLTDQQRWDTTGLGGNPLGLTPHFDRMARSGTHLPLFFTCQPVCAPARSCLQTGQYATRTGVYRNGLGLASDAVTLADLFGRAGYHTGYIGKWHLAGNAKPGAVPQDRRGGYQYWLGANALEIVSDAYRTVVYDGDDQEVRLPGYRVDAITDAAIRYIDAHQHEPFFLFVSYLEPHHQNHRDDFPPPDGYRQPYTSTYIPPDLAALGGSTHKHLGGYYGMVKRLDEALGRVRDALKSLELQDDTTLFFTSDHGCHFRTRNGEFKRSCHESSIHIPAAAYGPGFTGGGEVASLVSLVDVAPTLLDAAGLPPEGGMQGRSLLPLLRDPKAPWPEEVFVQISESQVGRSIRTQRWKYAAVAPGKDGTKEPEAEVYADDQLYDLESDPYELTNLVQRPGMRGVLEQLRARLIERMVQAGEPRPRIEPHA